MLVLILGVALWAGAHLFKRAQPARRAAMGEAGKGLITVLVLLSVALMIVGYRGADFIPLWSSPAFLTHLNNLLMLLAFYLYAASGLKTAITRRIRHPQLTAIKTWAVAHLLVNGDLASVILFGGLLAWAVVSVIVINRAQPVWKKPAPAPVSREIMAAVGAVVVMVAVMLIHNWLGVTPWG
ncbi:NnrU family protein [Szabonella alba]|uniref:NnrU family protein n=1 Tax=Szabonella alba TaxID=2804194 RepID=A0A8K0Y150_9RHOB|nr:NnrU family protein [Szabonella alba]MBL4915649.1 NnrU family protein [Szabonella alba]